MRRIFLFLFLLLLTSFSNTKAENTDSLLTVVNKANHTDRLELLETFTRKYPANIDLLEAQEKEAREQESYLHLASAYKSKVYYYTRIGNLDSTRLYLNQTEKALDLYTNTKTPKGEDKRKFYNIFKMLYTTRTALYLHEGKYNLALLEINWVLDNPKVDKTDDFENQLHTLSGMAYLHTKKYAEALSSFQEAGKLVEKTSNDSNIGKYSYYMVMEGISSTYAGLNNYTEALHVTDSLINKIEEEYKKNEAVNGLNPEAEYVYEYFKYKALMFKTLWLVKTNQLQKAKLDLDKVQWFLKEKLGTNPQHTDFDLFYLVEAEYYLNKKEYAVSEQSIRTLINRLSIQEQFPLYYQSNDLLSKILDAQGKNKEAFNLVVDLSKISDSINTMNFSDQLAEMNILYEVDKSKMLAEQRKSELKNTQIILAVIGIALILSLITGCTIYRSKKSLLEKNRQLYKQNQSIEDRNRKIKELEAIQNNLVIGNGQEINLHQDIVEKLDAYFEDDKAYLDQDVNRERIALEIGTNRQYLIEAIKEKTGKTFNEYINSYRLKYAYDLIVNDKDKTISEILNESGFSTRATFYKTFKEMYGLTPSELRDLF